MHGADTTTQEPRKDVVSVAVTAAEKNAVRAVASTMGISDSQLLRDLTMDEVMERYGRIRSALGAAATAAS